MNEAQKRAAKKILAILGSQRFAHWYGPFGRFDAHIRVEFPEGDSRHINEDMILNDIEKLFGIGDIGEIA